MGDLGSMVTPSLARVPLFAEGRGLVVLFKELSRLDVNSSDSPLGGVVQGFPETGKSYDERPKRLAGEGYRPPGEYRTPINVCYHPL